MKKLLFLSLIAALINSAEVDWRKIELSFQDLSQPISPTDSLIDLSARKAINSFSLKDALENMPADDLKYLLVKHWYNKNRRLIHDYANRIDVSNLESITITKNPNLISVYKDTIVIVSNNDLNNQVIKILDLNNNQIIQEIKTPHEDEIVATEISKKYVATISDSQVNIWNIKTGKLLSKFRPEKNSDQKLCYKKFENDKLILCYENTDYNINIFDINSESNSVINRRDFIFATTFNNILILVNGYAVEIWNINDKSLINEFDYSNKGIMLAERCHDQLILTLINKVVSIDIKDIIFLAPSESVINIETNFIPTKEYIIAAEHDKENYIEKVEVSRDKIIIYGEGEALDIFDNNSANFLYRILAGSIKNHKIYKNWIIIVYSDGFSIWNIDNQASLTKIKMQINDLMVEKNHLIIKNDNGVTVFNLKQPTINFLSQYSNSITFGKLIKIDQTINLFSNLSRKRPREDNSEVRNLKLKLDNFGIYDKDGISPEEIEKYLQEQQMLIDNLDQEELKAFIDEATAGPATN